LHWLEFNGAFNTITTTSQGDRQSGKVVIYWKWCKVEMLLVQTTKRKWHMAYQIITSLKVPLRSFTDCKLFKCDLLCSNWHREHHMVLLWQLSFLLGSLQ